MNRHIWIRMRKKHIKHRISAKSICEYFKNTRKSLPINNSLCYDAIRDKEGFEKEERNMANIFDFASFFIDLSLHNEDDPMTNLRLNKLLYFLQGYSLSKYGEPLFPDKIEAWTYGPVIPNIYHKYKNFKNAPIDSVDRGYSSSVFTPREFDMLLDVARVFGKYTSPALVNISHADDGPWKKARDQKKCEIMIDDIKSYFSRHSFDSIPKTALEKSQIIYGKRDKDGILVLPKELDDGWSL